MMKYSFVIPTYNNPLILNNTLEALNHLTGVEDLHFEVIVVDDGSTEDTFTHIKNTPRSYPFEFIYLPRTPDSCRARVRNVGWRRAQGHYVIFLDSDMIVAPNYLQELDRYYQVNDDLFVYSYRYMLKDPVSIDDVRSGLLFQNNYRTMTYMENRYFDAQFMSFNNQVLEYPWFPVFSCSMALPKSRLEEIGGFDEGYKGWGVEDWDVAYKCMKIGMKIVSHLGMEALHQYHGEVFGDLRPFRKMIEWDRNISYMYRCHPALRKELPRNRMNLAYFLQRVPQLTMRKEKERAEITFTNSCEDDIPVLLAKLRQLSSEPGRLLIVRDLVNSADLHLRIQLLGYTESEIRYFPQAFTLDPNEARRYIKSVFTWKRTLKQSFLGFALLAKKFTDSVQGGVGRSLNR
jgi:glycosyltransferase involved in cell wall biosynthesis